MNDEDEKVIKDILKKVKTIAVVGLSPDSRKPSNFVSKYLKENGYKIIPVYPKGEKILGEKVYKKLKDIDKDFDMVLVFRRSDKAIDVIKEAITLNKKPYAIWLQEGIISEEGKKLAEREGIKFVMDKCMYKEHIYYKEEL